LSQLICAGNLRLVKLTFSDSVGLHIIPGSF
jgi:hypothetical protein